MNRPEITRRDTIRGVAVLAAAEKLTDGGLAPVSFAERPCRDAPVLPPGARSVASLTVRCVACGRCMAACPEKIIRPSSRLSLLGRPELDFRHGSCLPSCTRCGDCCPTGAIERLSEETKAHVRIGVAVWTKSRCVRVTDNDECTACVRKCPVHAIRIVAGFPVVDQTACVGCGACEHVCPARPQSAIIVKGFEMQQVVRPISENDLLAEMRAVIDDGASVVVAKGGVIVASESGRGIGPILSMYDSGKLSGAVVCDKVVGLAAAAICVAGGVRKVFASLMSRDAAAFLAARKIAAVGDQIVPQIDNREKNGPCPMESAVRGLDDPQKMVAAIRAKLEELKKGKKQ